MTTTPQPKALGLAIQDLPDALKAHPGIKSLMAAYDAELRRQHAEIEALRAQVERELEARKAAQIRQAELTDEVVRLEPMRQRAADIDRLTAEVERLRADAERDAALHEQMLDALRSAVLALAGINSMYNDCCAREYLKVSNAIAAAREAKG